MDYLTTLQTLNSCHGPAGDEGEVANTLKRLAEPYADACTIDTMGNLIVHKRGPGPKVMIAAHMDSIGLIVTHVEKEGYLSFGKLGGLHPESLLHTPVRFKNGVTGVIALRQKVAAKDMTLQDLYVDIGANDAEEARRMVQVGDTAVCAMPPFAMGSHIVSPYLDNRISCVALLEALGSLEHHTNDLYFVFTVQEELGLRGSKPAAYAIGPDYALVVDVTAAEELDDKHRGSCVLGGGAAIKVMDTSIVSPPEMVELLERSALERDIPFQRDILTAGGTDAGSIHLTRAGVLTGGISIPCRYVHSPVEMVDTADVSAAVRLITAFAQKEF